MKSSVMTAEEKEFNDLMGQLTVGGVQKVLRFMKLLKNPGFMAEYKAAVPEGCDCLSVDDIEALMDKWEAAV